MRKASSPRKLLPFDVARGRTDDEAIAEYVSAVLEMGDLDQTLLALSDVARACGMAQVARDAGLGRESLYKALMPELHRADFTALFPGASPPVQPLQLQGR